MATNNTITVAITRATRFPSRAGFGTILLAAVHDLPGPLVRSFADIDEVEDTFPPASYPAINRAANVVFSQNPSTNIFKVGKRTTPFTQIIDLAPVAVQGEGFVWTVTIDDVAATFTEGPGEDVDSIIDGLIAAINDVGFTPTMTAAGVPIGTPPFTSLRLTADVAGEAHAVTVDLAYFDLDDQTVDPGIASDLSAIRSEDEDFYGLALDSNSPAEVAAAATWAEARTVLFGADAVGSDVADSLSTTDIGSVLQTALRDRTFLYWTNGRVNRFYGLAALAERFPAADPGTSTWKFKTPAGVDTYGTLVTATQATLDSKNVNHLEILAGVATTYEGVVSSGEFIDVIRTVDFLSARIFEDVYGVFLATPKIAYTDNDIEIIVGAIRARLGISIAANILAAEPEPTVVAPAALSVPAADRAERIVRNIVWNARLAGAVHKVTIRGTLEV